MDIGEIEEIGVRKVPMYTPPTPTTPAPAPAPQKAPAEPVKTPEKVPA